MTSGTPQKKLQPCPAPSVNLPVPDPGLGQPASGFRSLLCNFLRGLSKIHSQMNKYSIQPFFSHVKKRKLIRSQDFHFRAR